MLACVAPFDIVECEAFGLFEKYNSSFFNFYAISALPVGDISTPESVKFSVYPEQSEKRVWLNSTFFEPTTKKTYTYSLYSGPETTDRGFRVSNSTCFTKLVNLFTSMTSNETIVIGRASEKIGKADIVGGISLAYFLLDH
jgi:hypothetical protein